jgi:hypothetical protein
LWSAKELVGFSEHGLSQSHLSVDGTVLDWVDDEARHDNPNNGFDGVDNEQTKQNPINGRELVQLFNMARVVLRFVPRIDSQEHCLNDNEDEKYWFGDGIYKNVAQLHPQGAVGGEYTQALAAKWV